MHKGMLMAIEKARVLNRWRSVDTFKVKRLINTVEKSGGIKLAKLNTSDGEIYINPQYLGWIAKALRISLIETYNTEAYCLKQLGKYLNMALPILELKYDVVNIGRVDRCVDKGWWSIEIVLNKEKERLLTDCYEYVKMYGEDCFKVGSETLDKMCFGIGDKYFNPFFLK